MVRELLPSAYGLVVSHDTGEVNALHGESGTELWVRDSLEYGYTMAITPDGLRAVIVNPGTDHGTADLVVVDAGTGEELSSSPAPEGAVVHPGLVTDNHLLLPENGQVTAYDLSSGDPSWTYTPDPHCLPIPDFIPEEDWKWPVTTVEGSVLLPTACSDEGSPPPEPKEGEAMMYALALDERDGTEQWRSAPALITVGEDPSGNLAYYSMVESDDGEYLTQKFVTEFRLLDPSTGETLDEGWPDKERIGNRLTDVISATADHVVRHEVEDSEGQDQRYVKYSHSGDVLEEINIPPDHHVLMDAGAAPQEHRLAALNDGLLTPGCGNTCAGSSPQTPLDVRYTPWGDGDPVTIDLTRLDAHQLAENKALRLLPIPGAVIAYQQMSQVNPIGVFMALS